MNFEELAENLGLEKEEYLELVELFIETGLSDLTQMQTGIAEGNGEKAANAAHSVKGAASNLGLIEISDIAKGIEENARNESLEGVEESVQAIKERLDIISNSIGY